MLNGLSLDPHLESLKQNQCAPRNPEKRGLTKERKVQMVQAPEIDPCSQKLPCPATSRTCLPPIHLRGGSCKRPRALWTLVGTLKRKMVSLDSLKPFLLRFLHLAQVGASISPGAVNTNISRKTTLTQPLARAERKLSGMIREGPNFLGSLKQERSPLDPIATNPLCRWGR